MTNISKFDPIVVAATDRYVRRIREAVTTEDYLNAAQELGDDWEIPADLQGVIIAAALSIVAKGAGDE